MSDKTMNILRAAVCLFIALCCFGLKVFGIADADSKFPYVGGALCIFLTIAYLKQAFSQ